MRPRSYFKNKTSFAWFALTDLDFVFIISSTTHIPPILKHCKISVSHFWRIPDAIKKCYIFYIIKKDWLSPYCTSLATSFIKEHIPSNLHKQEVDVVGQLVGFDTRMQDKKVLILVKCNDYKIGVCIIYNFRNSDLYHIKNMSRLFPRP